VLQLLNKLNCLSWAKQKGVRRRMVFPKPEKGHPGRSPCPPI